MSKPIQIYVYLRTLIFATNGNHVLGDRNRFFWIKQNPDHDLPSVRRGGAYVFRGGPVTADEFNSAAEGIHEEFSRIYEGYNVFVVPQKVDTSKATEASRKVPKRRAYRVAECSCCHKTKRLSGGGPDGGLCEKCLENPLPLESLNEQDSSQGRSAKKARARDGGDRAHSLI